MNTVKVNPSVFAGLNLNQPAFSKKGKAKSRSRTNPYGVRNIRQERRAVKDALKNPERVVRAWKDYKPLLTQ